MSHCSLKNIRSSRSNIYYILISPSLAITMASCRRLIGSLDIPDHLTLSQFLFNCNHATRPKHAHLDETFLIDELSGEKMALDRLRSRSTLLANAIGLKWGIGVGDVVAVVAPNHIDTLVTIWAVHRLGGIITTADPTFSTIEDLVTQLKSTNTTLIIAHPDYIDRILLIAERADIPLHRILLLEDPKQTQSSSFPILPTIIADFHENDAHFDERTLKSGEGKTAVAFYFLSCGLSGRPKPLAISHYAIIASIVQRAEHFKVYNESIPANFRKFAPQDISLAVLPFSYLHGLSNILFLMYCGVSSVVVPKFDFRAMFKSITRFRITHLFLVPSQLTLICMNPLGRKYDMKHVKHCVVGGQALLSMDFIEDFAKMFPNCSLGQIYGLSEMSTAVAITPGTQNRMSASTTVGNFLPGIQFRVVKEDGSLAPSGERGELWLSGPAIAIGYLDNEAANRETFKDGWVRTGDIVTVDDSEELSIVGRCKSVFKVRAFQVSRDELEAHIRTHPDIDEVCVVSVPDLYSGEVPVAFVVLGDEAFARIAADEKELKTIKVGILRFVAEAKASYKWLGGGVEVKSSFPITPDGKVNREMLTQQAIQERRKSQI